jgi:hypothetical protein
MSKSALLQEIINYLLRQKALGKKTVYRTIVYAVMEDRVGAEAIGTGIAMSKSVMVEAARATGGIYLSEEGRARVLYN